MINDSERKSLIVTVPPQLADDLEILAYTTEYYIVEELLRALIKSLVDANKERIESFRNLMATPIVMPTFDEVDEDKINYNE